MTECCLPTNQPSPPQKKKKKEKEKRRKEKLSVLPVEGENIEGKRKDKKKTALYSYKRLSSNYYSRRVSALYSVLILSFMH